MQRDDHQVGSRCTGTADARPHRRQRLLLQRNGNPVGAGSRRRGRPARLIIGQGHHPNPQAACLQQRRPPRLLVVPPGTGVGHAALLQEAQHLQQSVFPVVEHVVIGQRHAIDAGQPQRGERDGVSPKVEDLGPAGPRTPAAGDDALQVHDREICGTQSR